MYRTSLSAVVTVIKQDYPLVEWWPCMDCHGWKNLSHGAKLFRCGEQHCMGRSKV
ncbi:hypothetical protein BDU57DRAFT_435785 [Ampelomyces quisqualis]|uniref:Uncharacterized protein n=1 Tax=Ampelomyces quisqualis TaxID=50730 RepID=A0A6A5R4S4_AMPQU|nr:hypothetical protein BDU57DRAFT_435785 [Ampelomyces quisqualis]